MPRNQDAPTLGSFEVFIKEVIHLPLAFCYCIIRGADWQFQYPKSMIIHYKDSSPHFFAKYRPVHKKYDSSKLKNFINEKFKKIFNFFTCILPNNVAHDITKEFWKNSNFENMTAVFFWAVKTDFGKLPLKKSIFRDDKNISSSILPR